MRQWWKWTRDNPINKTKQKIIIKIDNDDEQSIYNIMKIFLIKLSKKKGKFEEKMSNT